MSGFQIESVYLADPMGRPRPSVRVFASVGKKRYEFVRLDSDSLVEVYDYPRSWGGVARFVGYATKETGAHLVEMARDAVKRVAMPGEWHGRTHEMGGAS